jgi:hypothetical protein
MGAWQAVLADFEARYAIEAEVPRSKFPLFPLPIFRGVAPLSRGVAGLARAGGNFRAPVTYKISRNNQAPLQGEKNA